MDTRYVEPSGARMRNLTPCPPFGLTSSDAKHGRPCGGKEIIEEEPWQQLLKREETSVVFSYENVSVRQMHRGGTHSVM